MKHLLLSLILGSTIQVRSYAQDFYDLSTIQTIEISFSQSNWDALLDAEKATTENYIMADSVVINGVMFDSVGVKYKGNSTYNANQNKNPFHIELDTYKSQDYQGYKDIKLSNVAKDPSFLREVLSYQILRQYMHAPKSNYANVYVNGNLIGLYSNSEAITKTFLEKRIADKNNVFIKCNPPAGAGPGTSDYPSLVYLGTDSTLYYDAYELKSDFGWKELLNLCDTLDNQINNVQDILDVDRAIWMLAFDNVMVNLDSYIGGFAQNYYLYKDDFNRFMPIVWDLNESFGQFSMTGTGNLTNTTAKQQMDHLLQDTDPDFPLISQLLSIPIYKRMYLAHFKTILLENFDNGTYYTTGQTLQTLIDGDVQADGNKFYTYANFLDNLDNDITTGGGPGGGTTPGIANLMNTRSSYLLGLSDFTATQPDISNIIESNSTPALNDVVNITADILNETDVVFGYRLDSLAPFQKVMMFDDGLHNDGAAGDGTYGTSITMTNTYAQYYIYADNNAIGKFSPVRAEHEFHEIYTTTPPAGDLVINEFQADNGSSVLDPAGEYDDWIELYNNSSSPINLDTYYLSDDAGDLMKFQFPIGATIAAGAYYIVWADNDLTQADVHAGFKLSSSGETLFLSDASGVVDQVVFGAQNTDETYGRFPNGTGSFQAMVPTHSAQNSNVLSLDDLNHEAPAFTIYPNPANDIINVELTSSELKSESMSVFNYQGQLIRQIDLSRESSIDVIDWASGMYVAVVGTKSVKIIVQ
jgi:hypothetical protein